MCYRWIKSASSRWSQEKGIWLGKDEDWRSSVDDRSIQGDIYEIRWKQQRRETGLGWKKKKIGLGGLASTAFPGLGLLNRNRMICGNRREKVCIWRTSPTQAFLEHAFPETNPWIKLLQIRTLDKLLSALTLSSVLYLRTTNSFRCRVNKRFVFGGASTNR